MSETSLDPKEWSEIAVRKVIRHTDRAMLVLFGDEGRQTTAWIPSSVMHTGWWVSTGRMFVMRWFVEQQPWAYPR